MSKLTRLSEPFVLPLFCPECFAALDEDNSMLFPQATAEHGVGCLECWRNALCPGECAGVHGSPTPRGASRTVRQGNIPGTWDCPTTGLTYAYNGPNTSEGFLDHHNWREFDATWDNYPYLDRDSDVWFYDEDEYHEWAGHEWCDYCDQFVSDYDHYYNNHAEPEYDDYDDDYGRYDRNEERAIGVWERTVFTHYHEITEDTITVAEGGTVPDGYIPIPEVVSRVAA